MQQYRRGFLRNSWYVAAWARGLATASCAREAVGFVRTFKLNDPAVQRLLEVDFVKVFDEDTPVLEARHLLEQMIVQESARVDPVA